MDYIEWNYIQAKKQADKLSEQAARLRQLSEEKMEETLNWLAGSWKGDNADAYMHKGDKVRRELCNLAEDLGRTAEVIRSSAERTYRAEMKARELAQKRTY